MIALYKTLTRSAAPLFESVLDKRLARGKEDESRIGERKGQSALPRPEGALCWIHAASVGEAQSALILIQTLLASYPKLHILVTTGTLTSARLMQGKLPPQALHQFYPLDQPDWTAQFLDHWKPDFILWMESELWPNMVMQIAQRHIPAALINARLSPTSFARWRLVKSTAQKLLGAFRMILCQTQEDAAYYQKLGAQQVYVTDNLKYSAKPLGYDEAALKALNGALMGRPCWVYASTHKGEETLAAEVQQILKSTLPDVLTIIAPRHPERREEIAQALAPYQLNVLMRGEEKALPTAETDIYIADTMGELGLLYRAAPLACIGRSFSDDGGGGHNPIEAAQLGCAVLHGPHIQNLQEIFDQMNAAQAAYCVPEREKLAGYVQEFLSGAQDLAAAQARALDFAHSKDIVINRVMDHLHEMLDSLYALEQAK